MTRTLRPVGDQGWLVECPGEEPASVAAAVAAAALPGVLDVVPAAATVLVTVTDAAHLDALSAPLALLEPAPVGRVDDEVVLGVTYDGADLAAVAAATGLEEGQVVAIHHGAVYQVAFCGFAPGFAYLAGLDPQLHLPRRAEPRTRVPAGAVAIAGPYSAVYPRASPGGWHLLGRCAERLWDLGSEPPARLVPGTRVRFVEG